VRPGPRWRMPPRWVSCQSVTCPLEAEYWQRGESWVVWSEKLGERLGGMMTDEEAVLEGQPAELEGLEEGGCGLWVSGCSGWRILYGRVEWGAWRSGVGEISPAISSLQLGSLVDGSHGFYDNQHVTNSSMLTGNYRTMTQI
jgi:hypothetical protein